MEENRYSKPLIKAKIEIDAIRVKVKKKKVKLHPSKQYTIRRHISRTPVNIMNRQKFLNHHVFENMDVVPQQHSSILHGQRSQ